MNSSSAYDDRIRQWVRQSPADPNIQYLRDAEWGAALSQLGERGDVLDVASESNVTEELEAEHLTRLDFSPSAHEYAHELLSDVVNRFETTEPEDPILPFRDDEFDAAVCIGPYDWKFLDLEQLTAELHRVVDRNGIFVFSVPTPNSPYATDSRNRSYSPSELLDLLSHDWRIVDHDLIFQYPRQIHMLINRLSPSLQEPFVDLAWLLSDQLTARDMWNWASYLVVSAQPLTYASYLDAGLECLFRPVTDDGFWDPEGEKIIRALRYSLRDGNPVWSVDDSNEWRYAPFALMGVMQWRDSPISSDRYDAQIRRELEYFADRANDSDIRSEMPSYGLGPLIASFAQAGDIFDERYTALARDLFEYTNKRFDFDHAEDSLLVFGWAHLHERSPDEALRSAIVDGLCEMNDRLTPSGLFKFDNHTTRRHQNQMYTLWALCRAVNVTGLDGYLSTAERVLDYTIDVRMNGDGAFLWEDVPSWRKVRREIEKWGGRRPPHWEFLYECHQTFFVNAVAEYYNAGGEKNYVPAVSKAMAWIYGDNRLGENLVEMSGIGVPMRHMTTDGRMDVSDQMYKGAYEVGSYIMALTHLLDGTIPSRKTV